MLLRAAATAQNATTDQLYPEDVEREELTIRQFKSTVLIPTVTPITIFHITHGLERIKRAGRGRGRATEAALDCANKSAARKYIFRVRGKINLPLLLSGLRRITTRGAITRVRRAKETPGKRRGARLGSRRRVRALFDLTPRDPRSILPRSYFQKETLLRDYLRCWSSLAVLLPSDHALQALVLLGFSLRSLIRVAVAQRAR